MIKSIEMTKEDMEEILKHVPDHIKEKLFDAMNPDYGISLVKHFVEQYDDDDLLDNIIAHTISSLIRRMVSGAKSHIEDRRNSGKKARISTIDMAYISMECLKKEADNIREALGDHEEKCDKGKECGAKH